MKNLLFSLFILLIFGCNSQPIGDAAAADSTATTSTAPDSTAPPTPLTDVKSRAAASAPADFLTALGNEPGWILNMKKASDGSFPTVLIYSYGMDTLTGTFPANSLMPAGKSVAANQQFFAAGLNLRGKSTPVEVLVTQETCTDDAGRERPVQVKLTVGESWHPGCGSYVE